MPGLGELSEISIGLQIGKAALAPAPVDVMRQLVEVQVQLGGDLGSGFQLLFRLDHTGVETADLTTLPELAPWSRVLLLPQLRADQGTSSLALLDGVITHHQLSFDASSRESRFIVSGRDISILLDLVERDGSHRELSLAAIVSDILQRGDYSSLRLTPDIQIPDNVAVPGWAQPHMSDLSYLRDLANRCGGVFFIDPPDENETRRAYFGPLTYGPAVDAALCLQAGPGGNVLTASFSLDAERPLAVEGHRFNKKDTAALPAYQPQPFKELSANPVAPQRIQLLSGPFAHESTLAEQMARATVAATKPTVTAQISLDTQAYGAVLLPRQLVDVQGAGPHYEGTYYIESVTHQLTVGNGRYIQNVKLAREGLGVRDTNAGGLR